MLLGCRPGKLPGNLGSRSYHPTAAGKMIGSVDMNCVRARQMKPGFFIVCGRFGPKRTTMSDSGHMR